MNKTETLKWKPISGYEGLYDIRSDGLIHSLPRAKTAGGFIWKYKQIA